VTISLQAVFSDVMKTNQTIRAFFPQVKKLPAKYQGVMLDCTRKVDFIFECGASYLGCSALVG
jgi:hypothetical protein